jgi:hypothetical protein
MFHLRRHPKPQLTSATPGSVRVSVSYDVTEDFPSLDVELGAGFELSVDQPDGAAVAVVGPVGPVGVAFLCTAHLGTDLVVVDQFATDPGTVTACLDAGAAAYLCRPTVIQLSACVRSLASRHMALAVS